jgi:hypothetical protein
MRVDYVRLEPTKVVSEGPGGLKVPCGRNPTPQCRNVDHRKFRYHRIFHLGSLNLTGENSYIMPSASLLGHENI